LKQSDEENSYSFLRGNKTVSRGKVHTVYKYLTVKLDISCTLRNELPLAVYAAGQADSDSNKKNCTNH